MAAFVYQIYLYYFIILVDLETFKDLVLVDLMIS